MAYAHINFLSKKGLRNAVSEGAPVRIKSGVSMIPSRDEQPDFTGVAFLEGPWYPKPHTWYAKVQVTNGLVTKVLS